MVTVGEHRKSAALSEPGWLDQLLIIHLARHNDRMWIRWAYRVIWVYCTDSPPVPLFTHTCTYFEHTQACTCIQLNIYMHTCFIYLNIIVINSYKYILINKQFLYKLDTAYKTINYRESIHTVSCEFKCPHVSKLLLVSCGKQSASCLTSFQETKQWLALNIDFEHNLFVFVYFLVCFSKWEHYRMTLTGLKEREVKMKENAAHQSFCLFVIFLCWGQAPWAMQSKVWRSIEKGIHLCHTFQSRESLQRHETISE